MGEIISDPRRTAVMDRLVTSLAEESVCSGLSSNAIMGIAIAALRVHYVATGNHHFDGVDEPVPFEHMLLSFSALRVAEARGINPDDLPGLRFGDVLDLTQNQRLWVGLERERDNR